MRTGLLWWTVAVHLLASMLMVWLAVLLYAKIGRPDDLATETVVPRPLRVLTVVSAVTLTCVLIVGTMVTGAGPHAGDKNTVRTVPRLEMEISTLVHLHAELLVAFLALLIGLGFGLHTVHAAQRVLRRYWVLLAVVVAQATVGVVQYFTHVPAALVALHVAGAATAVAATAALWAAERA